MSASELRSNPDNFCYRHPDRQSFVLCQRCLRTICAECQTQMPVGVICPECLRDQQKSSGAPRPRRAPRILRAVRSDDSRPLVTYGIIGVTFFAFVVGLIPGAGAAVQSLLALYPPLLYPQFSGTFQPWRLFTVLFVHSGFWHVGLNMLALWMLGRSLEPMLGRSRFLWLYVLSGLGGSVAVVLFGFTSAVVGASGAIFGLFGALLVIGRHIGANITGIAVVLGINLVITFLPLLTSGLGGGGGVQISWQAHVGGLAAGALVGLIYARTRTVRRRKLQIWLLGATAAALVALLAVPLALY
ncbi:membrane associated rhomboid family serine protease [Microbacterium paludicola]|uniref:Membrane associated rhomboid family serine protease n=1 Tax=Microbacterium paludicola TaxID=300019 RepID=A0ABU1I252_9MICO|nr:rhomboid family intramembrane serine protease [Microbacterium paludicola]MDR6167957.1 membrane associated rhomboid family serine protease [Microbacterium paludicola]